MPADKDIYPCQWDPFLSAPHRICRPVGFLDLHRYHRHKRLSMASNERLNIEIIVFVGIVI